MPPNGMPTKTKADTDIRTHAHTHTRHQHMHTLTHTQTHTCTHAHAQTHTHKHTHTRTHTGIRTETLLHLHVQRRKGCIIFKACLSVMRICLCFSPSSPCCAVGIECLPLFCSFSIWNTSQILLTVMEDFHANVLLSILIAFRSMLLCEQMSLCPGKHTI